MPSAIWDWVAALAGFRPIDGLFLPTYWRLVAELTVAHGWAPDPSAVLWTLVVVSLAAVAVFLWRRRSAWLHFAFVLWGALLADTPYAVVLPLAVWVAWANARRVLKALKREMPSLKAVSWRRLGLAYVLAFLAVFAANLAHTGIDYIPGYARNALAAVRWDGGWHPWTTADMDGMLSDYAAELARESEGRRWLFTDGLCDAGIELAAAGRLRTVSLASGAESEAAWRARGFDRQEDLAALESGASNLLRAWVMDRPENLTNAAFQCGFSFLEQTAGERLAPHGLVMRSGDANADAADAAVRALADRIVEFYRGNNKPEHGGRMRNVRFCAMQWRVARAMRRQATTFDRRRQTREALDAARLSEELDRLNPFAKKHGAAAFEADVRAFGTVSPREGLAFALRRANFTLARHFAQPILKDDPENPEANFAMAMSHLEHKEYALARHYFETALRRRPDDVTLLNDLAVVLLELGEIEEAEAKARAALARQPSSDAVRDTLRNVELKKKKRQGK